MSKKIRNYDDDYKGLGDFSDYDYYYGNPGSGKDNRLNNEKYKKGGDRKETRLNTGVMYLLMAVFFGIMIFTVLIGRMYVKNSIASNIDSDQTAYVSSSDSNELSEPEPEPIVTVEQKIEEELNAMTLEQKVGQLFMVRDNGEGSFKDTVSKTHAGAAILFAGDFKNKTPEKVRKMIDGLQKASDGRMIIAVDEEGGNVVRISSNTKLRKSAFLSPQALYKKGGFKKIKSDTQEKCKLLDSLGLNSLGEDRAHNERTKSTAESNRSGDDRHEATQAQGNNKESLIVDHFAHRAQEKNAGGFLRQAFSRVRQQQEGYPQRT